VRLVGVQHHHAHVASVMAENGLDGDVIGLAMDGTGYGPDGTVWGGEVLRASPAEFRRLGHLEYVPLPGGDAAIEHPVRTAWAMVLGAFGPAEAARHLAGHLAATADQDRRLWADLVERGLHAPRASGLGRLFDAASALAGVCAHSTYEGQAAMELEAAAAREPLDAAPYGFAIRQAAPGSPGAAWSLDWRPLIRDLVLDLEGGSSAAAASARFHATVAAMLRDAARRAAGETGLRRVALSGGCFANARLIGLLAAGLEADGLAVYLHREVPPGDGGVALGQAYVAAAQSV
jgi:hydrogenase maturation protein HypF